MRTNETPEFNPYLHHGAHGAPYHLILPGLELASRLYTQLQEGGYGQSGTQALIHAIKKI